MHYHFIIYISYINMAAQTYEIHPIITTNFTLINITPFNKHKVIIHLKILEFHTSLQVEHSAMYIKIQFTIYTWYIYKWKEASLLVNNIQVKIFIIMTSHLN